MSKYILYDGELYHHGVKGMKWGRRKDDYSKRILRDHAGPGRYMTRKRQLVGDKSDLEGLKKGQHLSFGLTKKRQAAFDARDKAAIEKRISKNSKTAKSTSTKNKKQKQENAKKVASKVLKGLSMVPLASLMDDVFYGGMGKKAVGGIIKKAGRSVINAKLKRQGATNIVWHD